MYMELFGDSVIHGDDVRALVLKYRRGLVNSHLEYLILSFLEKERLCGYDVISTVYDSFHVLLSPGQVYPVINYLAAHGVISKEKRQRRILLSLTESGHQLLMAWRHELGTIQLLLNNQATTGVGVTVTA
jgi:DNA-binding PadR family transcriptional regulator